LASETVDRMRAALDDDLNTAQAQGAIFEMVRRANGAFDTGEIKQDDVAPLLAALGKFDEIFAVLNDDDGPKMKQVFDWAETEGREKEVSDELRGAVQSGQLSDTEIEKKIAEMKAARAARDFKRSDTIRAELANDGIAVESTKDGDRWRRTTYRKRLMSLRPVAVKLNQLEVHAPEHSTWGVVSCDGCKDRFAIGPNRIFPGQTTPEECAKELEGLLKADHQHGRPHANSYELKG